MYGKLFYYFYKLYGITPNGKLYGNSVFFASQLTLLLVLFHLGMINCILCIPLFDINLFSFIRISGPYLIRKFKLLPFFILLSLFFYAYFKWRFPKIKQKFSAYTDKEILCWKNHVFVILITLIPLVVSIILSR